MPLTLDVPTPDESDEALSSETLDVGPSRRTILARTARVLLVLFVCGAGIAGVVEVTRTTSSHGPRTGALGYQWLFASPVKSGSLYLVNQDFAVMTPPIYDAGDAPLTLETVTPLVTGCPAKVRSSVFYITHLIGVEAGPGDTPRSQWKGFGIDTRVVSPGPVTLNPGTDATGRRYVSLITVTPPNNGPWGIEGYKVTYLSNGLRRVGYLDDPQIYFPSVASLTANGSLPGGLFNKLLGQESVSRSGATHGFDCQSMTPIPAHW